MNINQNNTSQQIRNTSGVVSVQGNGNRILVKGSRLQINVNGNQNRFEIEESGLNITINGNLNQLIFKNSQANFGFNGNNNAVVSDQRSRLNVQYCNGVGNRFPGQEEGRERVNNQPRNMQRPARQNQQQQVHYQQRPQQPQQPQQRQQPQNAQRQYRQVPPQRNQMNQMQGGQQYNFNQQMGQFSFPENPFIQLNIQHIFDMMRPPPPREYRGYRGVYAFDNFEEREEEEQEEERPGLTANQINMLPRAPHEGASGKCTICLCEIDEGEQETFLVCFHSFHGECIRDWLVKSGKCPVCQHDLKEYLQE